MVSSDIVGQDGGSAAFPLDRSKIRELVLAIGEQDPIHTDREAAAAAGFADVVGPLTWPVLVGHWRDGAALIERLGLDYRRLLAGETSWEYVRPAVAGEEITATRVVEDVTTREGKRGGQMMLVRFKTTLANADGEVLAYQYDTLIQTGG